MLLTLLLLASALAPLVAQATASSLPSGEAGGAPGGPPSAGHTFPTPIRHVFVVTMENARVSTTLTKGPFERHLTQQFASAGQYYAVCHPSAPNYLALTSGAAFQCGSDSYATHSTENLGDLAQKAGLRWDGYMESMPKACATTDAYPYAVKHNPFVYYPDIVRNSSECRSHVVPFKNWTQDLSNGTIPNFGFFTPNLKHDGHDTGVAYGDAWLKGWLSPLLNDSFYSTSVFFVVYDESVADNSGFNHTTGGHVYFSAVSPFARSGFNLTSKVTHYNLLTTMEWLLGLGSTGQNDSWAKWPPMKSLFSFPSVNPIHAAGQVAPSSGVAPLNVSFQSNATGGVAPYRYQWDFGDGSSSSHQNPHHRYAGTGVFSATVRATDSKNRSSKASLQVTVVAPGGALTALGSASPTSGRAPLAVQFHGNASGGKPPYTYQWNFGGPLNNSTKSPRHTYLYPGKYTATLTVHDTLGHGAIATVNISAASLQRGLSATLSPSNSTGFAPYTVRFTANASGGSGPYRFNWSFGDGTTGVGSTPSHTFRGAGTYSTTLQVTDAAGSSVRTGTGISVSPKLAGIPGALSLGNRTAVTPGTFWSIDAQTTCASCISTNLSVTRFLNQTPFTWVRYGQGTDRCNISLDRSYSDAGVAAKGCGYDLAALKTWCAAQTPHCHSIISLPGENNNSREDAAIAHWVVSTLGFQPSYWSIGNEPTGWTHYGIPWTSWKLTDNSTPTPLAYAFDVKAAIAAVKAVDPGAKFIGIQAACSCNTVWFQDVAAIDGSQISAMGVHSYPSSGTFNETLAQFFSPLLGPRNLSGNVEAVHSAIHGLCTSCTSMPVFVNEYNAGPGWGPSTLGGSYANAAFLAASVVQGLESNVTQLTIFNLQNGQGPLYGYALLNVTGVPGPNGLLFSQFLSHLAVGSVYPAPVAGAPPDVWSVVTANTTSESLLVVNTNLSHAIALTLGTGFPTAVLGAVYQWNASLPQPRASSGLVALGYSVPSEGMLLITVSLPVGVHLAPRTVVLDPGSPSHHSRSTVPSPWGVASIGGASAPLALPIAAFDSIRRGRR